MLLPRREPPDLPDDPGERMELALRLGERALDAFLATQPPGTTRDEARAVLQRNKHRGRRSSGAAGSS